MQLHHRSRNRALPQQYTIEYLSRICLLKLSKFGSSTFPCYDLSRVKIWFFKDAIRGWVGDEGMLS